MKSDLYIILEVKRDATFDEIRTAYRKKVSLYHPDKAPNDPEALKKFLEVQEAYDTLGDAVKRSKYDNTYSPPSPKKSPKNRPFGGIWDNVPGQVPPQKGSNTQINLEIDLLDVFQGKTTRVTVPEKYRCDFCEGAGYTNFKPCNVCKGSGKTTTRESPFNYYQSCHACKGSGRAGTINCHICKGDGSITRGNIDVVVIVPVGAETGHRLKIDGYGEPSKHPFGVNGDLSVIIVVKAHRFFKRQNGNLILDFPVGYSELCLGATLEIPTLKGTHVLTIPPRTVDNAQLRIKGLGLPYVSGGRGDLIVIVKLQIPPKDKLDVDIFDKLTKLEQEYLSAEREKFTK